jgi:hypothetical protein
VTAMATETTPIHDSVISELGNPIPATPIDCSYAAMVKLATAGAKVENVAGEPKALPAPASAKRPMKAGPPKPFAVVAHDKAS